MLIFTTAITPRLQYVAHFLEQYFSTTTALTIDKGKFAATTDVRLNYSEAVLTSEEIWLAPTSLLFETDISNIPVNTFLHSTAYKAFFASQGVMGFDLFAAIFYLLSRYEEYLPHQKDEYGRYAHQNSIAYKEGFLHQPLINIWLEDFRKLIAQNFPNCKLQTANFSFIPTYDIDIAWSFRNKGVTRTIGGIAKNFVHGEWQTIKDRMAVLQGSRQDPFNSYEWVHQLHKQHHLKPVYFFHAGQKRNRYDKNISTKKREYQNLVSGVAQNNYIGLHPSWHSNDETKYLEIEKAVLEKISEKQITSSRQHYIRFTLPETYRQLIKAGIKNDWSMGYGSINGFRGSVATPFYWYDLAREQQTDLLIYPFCFMDANSFFEQKQTAEEGLEELLRFYKEVKAVNGTFITIWHNTFLGTDKLFSGWRETYQQFLKFISTS